MDVLCLKLRHKHRVWSPEMTENVKPSKTMDVLCLKLRHKHRVWSPEMTENVKPSKTFHSKSERLKHIENLRPTMSLQMPITEDTPPDMLSGAMDLNVILPNGSVIKMSVERSMPMMDLLVQITTAHKLSPGSHAIHAIGDRGILPYKPSTPIGALDTWTVNIVPKNSSKNGRYQNQSIIKCITKPFEQTFRLQVHLPRNQLYVSRISPKTQLKNILKQVCFEKNLDPAKYTLRKPEKLNEPLDLSKTLVEYKLQQLSLVLNTNRALIGGLSSDDIMSRTPKKFSCDDSLSSGSLGGRSLSPTKSDESSDVPRHSIMVKVLPSRPVRKRRLAPKPPSKQQNAPEQTIISHSRNSSDSSGYHESSVFSDAVDCSVGMTTPGKFSSTKTSGPSMSRSMTNLQACGQIQNQFSEVPFMFNNIGHSKHSVSTTSLVSIQSRKKKAAPLPPLANKPKLAPPQEESENEQETQRKSQTLPVTTKICIADAQEKSNTVARIELNNNIVVPNLSPATSSLSSLSRSDVDRDLIEPTSPASSIVVGCKYLSKLEVKSKRPAPKPPMRSSTINRLEAYNQPGDLATVPRLSSGSTADEDDLRMDDEEIDRIFGDATNGYDTPSIITVRENHTDVTDIDWEYKLPDPPSAFRDDDNSPTMTMFDTVTIGNLKDVVLIDDSPISPVEVKEDNITVEESVKKFIGDQYHSFPQDSGVGSDDSSLPSSCEEKLHTDEKLVKTIEPKESKLNNFKIVAYDEDCTRPTEIFCDDSVKTWKTTQMARESNPAYKSQTFNSVNRHKSLSMDRNNFPITVKRSTSHISLLSGNIKPSNRLAKHYIGRTYSSERLNNYDDYLVKRSYSVDNITEDLQESSLDDYENKVIPKKLEPTLEQSSPLHSLQVLKTILPQIEEFDKPEENNENNRFSYDEVSDLPDTSLAETGSEENGENQLKNNLTHASSAVSERRNETVEFGGSRSPETTVFGPECRDEVAGSLRQKPAAAETSGATIRARTDTVRRAVDEPQTPNERRECRDNRPEVRDNRPEARDADEKVKRYSYAGPPKISLSTWNERPKRQVSIKTDRDYVIGIRQRLQQKAAAETAPKHGENDPPPPVSRVPIVKSVELKKPYAEQLHATGPVLALSEAIRAQAKLSNGFSYHGNAIALKADDGGVRKPLEKKPYDGGSPYTFGKLTTTRQRKPREISTNVDPRETLLESIRSFGGRDSLRKIRA